jgi:hypothetical protein
MKLNKLSLFILMLLPVISCSGGGSSGGGSGTSTVTLSSITVTPANPSIAPGTTEQFTAIGTYSDASNRDITTSVTWNSSNTGFATIDTAGLATAVATGNATITASSGSITGSTILTVTSATIKFLVVTPASPASIALGATQQFTAMGTFSDSTTQVLTTLVSWSSSLPSVATISNSSGSNGLATSFATGTTTIKATWNGASDSTAATVTPMDNVLTVTVNGSLCLSNSYPNKPCVMVTICSPGTSTCQTIDGILLDTGAFGLRIFESILTIPLAQMTSGSGLLTECMHFGDGSTQWGPVQTADVMIGNEPAVNVPIQVVDSTFGTVPSSCGTPDKTPQAAGFNGILGVGLFTEDCGSGCASSVTNNMYYSCNGSTCTPAKAPLTDQVKNPVSLLPVDNNGVIVRLPSVPLGGAASVNGILVLGIGTQSNNTPSGVTMYNADPSTGEFITVFNGNTYGNSFIDSGSNGLFFDARSLSSTLPTCGDWFCPASMQSLYATNKDYAGSPAGDVSFQIGNATNLFSSSNHVFIELGGQDKTYFDWGVPFFLGRSVYVGIDGKTSSLGTGPYWAY